MAWQIHSQHNQLHNDMMQYEPQQQQAMYQDDYIHNDPDLAFDPPFDLALGNMSSREDLLRDLDLNQFQYTSTQSRSNTRSAGTVYENADFSQMNQEAYLLPTSILPHQYKSIFAFDLFNPVQTKVYDSLVKSQDNIVVSAPTGSGKTVIFELAIIRAISQCKSPAGIKAIYMAPTKALCMERFEDWSNKFKSLGLSCGALTGDTHHSIIADVKRAHIIITTPEKWDSCTRRWTDHKSLMSMVKLFMVDEVHILNESRGAVLEVLVTRMKTMGIGMRFIMVSATVPNIADIAAWVGLNPQSSLPASTFDFGEEYRPVHLEKHVYGYQKKNQNDFMFDKTLDKQLPTIIQQHSLGKPTLIFCNTRKACVVACEYLRSTIGDSGSSQGNSAIRSILPGFKDTKLQNLVMVGIAFHHAGLDSEDRRLVEQLFLEGAISVLCTTSTLAVGVNLPAYLVIIKGTSSYKAGSGFMDYSDIDLIQMIGRAGRPQFESHGVAVILTSSDKKAHFENVMTGQQYIESQLHFNLTEHLNAEIGLRAIDSKQQAYKWLKSTFLYIRMQADPNRYKVHGQTVDTEENVRKICQQDIERLIKLGAVVTDEKDTLTITPIGDIMSRYYVKFDTMERIVRLDTSAPSRRIFETLCQAEEFDSHRFRHGEKTIYKEINKHSSIKWSPAKLTTAADKVSLLIQSAVGGVEIKAAGVALEISAVMGDANRIARCIVDCMVIKASVGVVKRAFYLQRSIKAKCWIDSPLVLRQLPRLGEAAVRSLAFHNIRSLPDLRNADPRRLEVILKRKPPFGNEIVESVNRLPRLTMSARCVEAKEIPNAAVRMITMQITLGLSNVDSESRGVIFLAGDASSDDFFDFRRTSTAQLQKSLSFIVKGQISGDVKDLTCYLMCEDLVGCDVEQTLQLPEHPDRFAANKDDNTDMDLNDDFEFERDLQDISYEIADGSLLESSTPTTSPTPQAVRQIQVTSTESPTPQAGQKRPATLTESPTPQPAPKRLEMFPILDDRMPTTSPTSSAAQERQDTPTESPSSQITQDRLKKFAALDGCTPTTSSSSQAARRKLATQMKSPTSQVVQKRLEKFEGWLDKYVEIVD